MSKTFNTSTTSELLKASPKALQFLNDAEKMDFQKPYIIIKASGKFTFNTVTKALTEAAPDYTSSTYSAGILMYRDRDYCKAKMYYVAMHKHKFDVEKVNNVSYYNRNIDNFLSVGNFETSRKENTTEHYIIAQRKDLLNAPKQSKNIDLSQRFKLNKSERIHKACDGTGHTWLNEIPLILCDGSNYKFKYAPFNGYYPSTDRTEDITHIIDNSGYLLVERRRELKRKANALRAERSKAAAAATRYTEREAAILAAIEAIKKAIASDINTITSGDTMRDYSEKLRKLSYTMKDYENHISRTENGRYNSVDEIERTLSRIEEDLKATN